MFYENSQWIKFLLSQLRRSLGSNFVNCLMKFELRRICFNHLHNFKMNNFQIVFPGKIILFEMFSHNQFKIN